MCTDFLMVDMLNIIRDNVNKDDQFIRIAAAPQDMFLALVSLILAFTSYTFNSHFYQHTNAVSMGQPVSSTTTETYVLDHEQIAIVYSIFNHISNFHQSVEFNMEE